jgi:hypothetical protein
MSSSETDSGQMKMNFKKPREVFLHNGMKNKNLSHFFHRCHEQGESKPSFRPFFPDFSFFRYSPDFAGAVTASWRRIWRNRRRFLSITCPYTITSFSFFPGVIIEEKQMSVRTPFLQKLGPSFMADSSDFWGFVAIFGQGG